MSLVTRIGPVSARVSVNTTAPVLSVARTRFLSSTVSYQKGPIETTKETLKKIDRTISNAAVKGIETGEKVTEKARETIGGSSKAAHLKGDAQAKAEELAREAKGKVKNASSKVSA